MPISARLSQSLILAVANMQNMKVFVEEEVSWVYFWALGPAPLTALTSGLASCCGEM